MGKKLIGVASIIGVIGFVVKVIPNLVAAFATPLGMLVFGMVFFCS